MLPLFRKYQYIILLKGGIKNAAKVWKIVPLTMVENKNIMSITIIFDMGGICLKKRFKLTVFTSIRVKFLLPILAVILAATIGLSIFAYENLSQTLNEIMKQTTEQKVQDTKNLIKERQDNMVFLKEAIDKYLIDITKGVAETIAGFPDKKLDAKAADLAESLGIEEIHIIDGNGVLQWGNVPDVFGFDFNTSEQTKPFLEGLTNKEFAMAQDPQPRGADGKLFQYITVARIDKPGLVQIGITPEEMNILMDKINVKGIAMESKVGTNGYVIIMDLNGTIVSHPDSNLIGRTRTSISWGSKIKADKGSFLYDQSGGKMFLSYEKTDQYIIAATVPLSDYYVHLKELGSVIIFIILFTALLASAIIYFVSNSTVIKRIKKMLMGVNKIGEGDLSTILEDKSQDELGQLISGLNKMVENLRLMAVQIDSSTRKLNETADSVAKASEQTSVASQEIAESINQIATGTGDQAEEVSNSVGQLGTVTRNIDDIIENTKVMSEKVMIIEKQNKDSLNTVNALKDKFTDNKTATAKAMEIISMLADKSGKISEITDSITAISSQTNLLAMNASIEAARAGESGRGFAVVANEVKSLAAQSARAAQGIGALISEISRDIEEAVKSINLATKTVKESDDKLKNTVETFNLLKDSNDVLIGLSNKMNEICISLNENTNKAVVSLNTIAAVSEETAATTEEISASTEEQTASIMEISESVNGVKELAGELANMISRFKTE
jgi:methyl-accepting chemotaxis protein